MASRSNTAYLKQLIFFRRNFAVNLDTDCQVEHTIRKIPCCWRIHTTLLIWILYIYTHLKHLQGYLQCWSDFPKKVFQKKKKTNLQVLREVVSSFEQFCCLRKIILKTKFSAPFTTQVSATRYVSKNRFSQEGQK